MGFFRLQIDQGFPSIFYSLCFKQIFVIHSRKTLRVKGKHRNSISIRKMKEIPQKSFMMKWNIFFHHIFLTVYRSLDIFFFFPQSHSANCVVHSSKIIWFPSIHKIDTPSRRLSIKCYCLVWVLLNMCVSLNDRHGIMVGGGGGRNFSFRIDIRRKCLGDFFFHLAQLFVSHIYINNWMSVVQIVLYMKHTHTHTFAVLLVHSGTHTYTHASHIHSIII